MLRFLPLLLLIPLLFFSCAPPDKLIEQGDYARALEVSSSRLRIGRIKAAELGAFETSFYLLTRQDSQHIAELRATGRPDVWPEIYQLTEKIAQRQQEVFTLVQELDKAAYHPDIDFYPAKELMEEAAGKSALFHYANAQEYIPAARSGDRRSARLAYDELNKSLSYLNGFRNGEDLLEEMQELGTTHLLLNPVAHPYSDTYPAWAVDHLLRNRDFAEQQDWLAIYLERETAARIDYEVDFYFSDLSVSPNRENQRVCVSTKEVEDGFTSKKVWSEKDSAYVEVKEIKYTTVSGTVTNILQEKEASASVRFTVIDANTFEPVGAEQVWGDADWDNEYSLESGDSRALPGSCSTVIGFCAIFPSDGNMLSEAISDMRNAFWRRIQDIEDY